MVRSMTSGSPARLILLFAFPLFIGNLFQQVYNMADAFIVGRMLGVNALAAVGCTGSLTFFIIGFAQGLSAGFSMLTARRFGARDEEGVRRSYAASLLLGGGIGLVLTVAIIALGIWFIRGPKPTGSEIPPFVPPMEPEEEASDPSEEEARHEAQ